MRCLILGWGTTSHPGPYPSILQQIEMPIVKSPHKGCRFQSVICAGYGFNPQPDGSQQPNASRGDSGGPYVCLNAARRFVSYNKFFEKIVNILEVSQHILHYTRTGKSYHVRYEYLKLPQRRKFIEIKLSK